ncbi:MAG: PilZ domain-containing protein [Firmicutes bacterium]|nr:PilZ domain-containing protein [Bacillota bacterium]
MEKRRFSRVPFHIQVEIDTGEIKFTGEVKDLSLKGMFIISEHILPLDKQVSIKIYLTGTNAKLVITLEGKVIRKATDGFAVYFDAIDLDSFILLKNIIDYNSADPEKIWAEYASAMKP